MRCLLRLRSALCFCLRAEESAAKELPGITSNFKLSRLSISIYTYTNGYKWTFDCHTLSHLGTRLNFACHREECELMKCARLPANPLEPVCRFEMLWVWCCITQLVIVTKTSQDSKLEPLLHFYVSMSCVSGRPSASSSRAPRFAAGSAAALGAGRFFAQALSRVMRSCRMQSADHGARCPEVARWRGRAWYACTCTLLCVCALFMPLYVLM